MDFFLNRAYTRLNELYRSMTPGSRLTAGSLLAAMLLSLGYLFHQQGAAPEVDLMHGVPVEADQLRLMDAAFNKAGLKGFETRGSTIYVPGGQQQAFMGALADAKALPPRFGDALREAINAGNPFENSRHWDQRTKIATQDELAHIITAMAGVEKAYVLYDVDTKPGFNKDKIITATACIKPIGSGQLDEGRVAAIRHLVAGAIAGMKPENVTVSDLNGPTWHGNADGTRAEENRHISLQRTYEQDLKAKILNALCFIPNVTVEPSVTLDREPAARVRHNARPSTNGDRRGGWPVHSATKESRGSRSSFGEQRPNTAAVLGALLGGPRNEEDATETDGGPLASGDDAERESVALRPISARVSVGVPVSYFKKIWRERNPVEAGQPPRLPDAAALDQIRAEESVKIQRHVAQLLPRAGTAADAAELVTVTTFQDISVPEPTAPTLGQSLLNWAAQSWTSLGMIGLGVLSLVVLRSLLRPRPQAADAPASPLGAKLDTAVGHEPFIATPHSRRWRRFDPPEPSLREELSELVQDNPDAAANVLRSWIGQVNST